MRKLFAFAVLLVALVVAVWLLVGSGKDLHQVRSTLDRTVETVRHTTLQDAAPETEEAVEVQDRLTDEDREALDRLVKERLR